MARIRTIKPEFFTNDDVCALSPLARLLFIGCWCEADREGRLEWRPQTLKRKYLPEDDCDADRVASELVDLGLIVLYGQGLAVVKGFKKHQVINLREAQSKLPEPPAITCNAHALPEIAPGKGKEGKGKEQPNGCLPAERGKATRKSAIPPDWKPTAELIEYAKAQGCADPTDTFERFRLHHASKGTLHKDWTLAAQYWCRNESRFSPKATPRRAEIGMPASHNDASQWRARVLGWSPGRFWNRGDWGPEPGEQGCRAPAPILDEWRAARGGNA